MVVGLLGRRWRSIVWIHSLIDLVRQSMPMKNYCYLLHSIKFGGKLTDVHSNVLCENRWTEWCREMIPNEQYTVFLDIDLVHQVHLCYWKTDLGINHFFELPCDLIDSNHLILT